MALALLSNLGVVCPRCATLNGPRVQRCVECGAATDAAAPAPPGMRPSRAPPTEAVVPPAPASSEPPRPSPGVARPRPSAGSANPPTLSPTPERRPPAAAPPPSAAPPTATAPASAAPPLAATGPALTAPRPATPRPAAQSRFILNVVAGSSRGQRFRLLAAGCGVGRDRGAIQFQGDPTVAAQHAAFLVRDNTLFVKPGSSHAAVYISLRKEHELAPGDRFAVGSRLIRFRGPLVSPPVPSGRVLVYGAPFPPNVTLFGLEELLTGDRAGRAIVAAGPVVTVGQSGCDFTFAGDAGLAGRHCEVLVDGPRARLRDVSGGLGTFVRIATAETELVPGDRVRIGDQTVSVELS